VLPAFLSLVWKKNREGLDLPLKDRTERNWGAVGVKGFRIEWVLRAALSDDDGLAGGLDIFHSIFEPGLQRIR